jgi:hypothetical protein
LSHGQHKLKTYNQAGRAESDNLQQASSKVAAKVAIRMVHTLTSSDRLTPTEQIEKLEADIALIKLRNEKVDADKAWETSATRVTLICLITYSVASVLLLLLGNDRPWFSAFVPVAGFYLSSRTIAFAKTRWLSKRASRLRQL